MSDVGHFEADPADVAEQETPVLDDEEPAFVTPATHDPEVDRADAAEQAAEVCDSDDGDPR
jgi:hypothetical protein